MPVVAAERGNIMIVSEVIQLDGGRVAALVQVDDGDPATEDAEAVMLLAFDEAFWKIDDIRILGDATTPVA